MQEQPKTKTAFRWWLAITLLAPVVVLIALFAVVQTPAAKGIVASRLSALLSSPPEQEVVLEGLEGLIPLHMRLDRIVVKDREGSWITVEDAKIHWRPLALFSGRIVLDEVSASRVTMERTPQGADREEPEEFKPFKLPQRIPSVTIRNVEIPEIHVCPGVLGDGAVFRIQGAMSDADDHAGAKASLHLERIDEGPKTRADVMSDIDWKSGVLGAEVTLVEEEEGWLASVLGLHDIGPLGAALKGRGPLTDWNGAVEVSSGRFGVVRSKVLIGLADQIHLALDGKYDTTEGIFPPDLVPLLGGETLFRLEADLLPSQFVKLEKVDIEGKGYTLRLVSALDLQDQTMEGNFAVHVGELNVLEALMEEPMSGELAIEGVFSGPVKEPRGNVAVKLKGFETRDLQVAAAVTDLRLEPVEPSVSESSGLRITGTGTAEEIAWSGDLLLSEKAFQWALECEVLPQSVISLHAFELKGEHHRLNVSGQYNQGDAESRVDVVLDVKDLRALSGLAGGEIPGSARVHAKVAGNVQTRNASGSLDGHVIPSDDTSSTIAALVGSKSEFSADVELREGDLLSIPVFKVLSPVFALGGQASTSFARRTLEGDWNLVVARLKSFEEVLGKPLSGSLQAKGEIEGAYDAFRAKASLEGDAVVLNNMQLQKALLDIRTENLPASPKGDFRLELRKKDARINASADFSLREQEMELSSLVLKAPGSELKGNISIDFTRPLIRGSVDAALKELAALGRFIGEKMEGTATLRATFDSGKTGQDVMLRLKGNGLSTPFGKTKSVSLDADLENVFATPKGSARLNIEAFERPDLLLDSVVLKTSGDERGMNFQGKAKGRSVKDFFLETSGVASFSESGEGIRIDKLQGNVGEHSVRLNQPATLRRSSESMSVEGLALDFGAARLRASGGLDPQRVLLDARLENFPLTAVADFGGPPLNGEAAGRVQMSGALNSPSVRADLQLSKVRSSNPKLKDVPPTSISARGTIEGGLLKTEMEVRGPLEKPARVTIQLPMALSIEPFNLSVPPDGALRGNIDAEAQLAALTNIIHLGEQSLSGLATVSLDIQGRLDAPRASGNVILKNGSYENYLHGTVLKNLELKMQARGDRLEIERAQASDGAKGRISVTGSVIFDASGGFPVDMNIKLSEAVLVRREDFSGTTNGDLRLAGTLKELALKGGVRVGPAEITLPRRLPPRMTELEVTEIHEVTIPKADEAEPKTAASSPMTILLDLKLNFPRRIYVRGWGLDSEWQGNLRIEGTADDPAIVGSLSPVRGKFDFLSRRFDLAKGDITFYGARPPAPILNITAESAVKEITARLLLTGPASAPKLTLESDPPLPQDEILAQILFGRTTSQITPAQALKLASALQALSGVGGSFGFIDRTRRLLGLDELELREAENGDGPGSIGIGKYLTEDIYVDVQKGVGQEKDKASVEVELTPKVTVKSEIGSDASGGIGVNWKYDY